MKDSMRRDSNRLGRTLSISLCTMTFAVLFASVAVASGDLMITEFMAINDSTLADQDGSFRDWIEIHNPTGSDVDLDGWALTDDAADLAKWRFPAVTIAAGDYLVVFASDKDRTNPASQLHLNFKLSGSGEYLALVRPDGSIAHDYSPAFPPQVEDVSYGVGYELSTLTLVAEGDSATALVPTDATDEGLWYAKDFDDSAWLTGNAGIGFDDAQTYIPLIGLDVNAEMNDVNPTVYCRMEFNIDAGTVVATLMLRMKYDDGFIAYLNGVRIAGANDGNGDAWNANASGGHADSLAVQFIDFDVTAHVGLLVEGKNVLAIHGLNTFAGSRDMLISPELTGTLDTSGMTPTEYFFIVPTPGAANSGGILGYIEPVDFSVDHGFYDAPISLALTSTLDGAEIRYTLDGGDPADPDSGFAVYTEPIAISDTTAVRAAAFKDDYVDSLTFTQTYIYLESVLVQGNDQSARDLPDEWFAGFSDLQTYDRRVRTADYEMDPEIVNDPVWGPQMMEALTSIPTMSLVLDTHDLFDPMDGIYPNSIQEASSDRKWEKPASLELIYPDGGEDFSVNAGARISGELARWAAANDKQSFRLVFKSQYGPSKLKTTFFDDPEVDKYDTIILRSHWGQSWLRDEVRGDAIGVPSWVSGSPYWAQYTRDLYAMDTFASTGQVSVRGRFVQLYLNGVYWGLYEVIERPDNSFHAEHFGGDKDDYDVIKGAIWSGFRNINGSLQDGAREAWTTLMSYFDTDSTGKNYYGVRSTISDAELAEIEQYLDVDQFIDFMMTMWVLNRGDFPQKNWYAVSKRGESGETPEIPFRVYVWDSDASLQEGVYTPPIDRWHNPTDSNDTGPVRIYWRLLTNATFRQRWVDRANELFGVGGPFTPAAMVDRYFNRAAEIDMAILGESARWGDWSELHHDNPMTKDHWETERDRLLYQWLPARPGVVLDQMASVFNDYDPTLGPPIIVPDGGLVPAGFQFRMVNPNEGGNTFIVYTLDGCDPAAPDGGISPSAEPPMLSAGVDWIHAGPDGTVWSYYVDLADPAAGWMEPGFDAGAWPTGAGQLGYGDGDEETVVGWGGDSQNKNITTYFRTTIDLDIAVAVSDVMIRMIHDDGVVVYFNGVEVLRGNMPDGPITADTPASQPITGWMESTWVPYPNIDTSALVDGENVVVVAIHQDAVNGSDISFDMEMSGRSSGLGFGGVQVTEDTFVIARVYADGVWSAKTEALFIIDELPTLAISEFDYHPADPTVSETAAGFDNADDFEFIEIHNFGAAPVTQIGAAVGGGVDVTLDAFTIMPGDYAVVVRDRQAFQTRYGTAVMIIGEWGDRALQNAGEQITLTASNGQILDDFIYEDALPWDPTADGFGPSLNRPDPYLPADDPASWVAAAPTPGCGFGLTGLVADFNSDDVVDVIDVDMLAAAIRDGSTDLDFDLDGDGSVTDADMDELILNILGTAYGDLDLDGDVDLSDFHGLKTGFGSRNAGWADGDFDGNSIVALSDFKMLKDNFGFVAP